MKTALFQENLIGYTSDRPLHQYRQQEHAFGHGDFLTLRPP